MDRLLLETLEPATRFYQFGSKKPLPKGEGNAVQWNRPYSLAVGVVLTEGTAPTANELSTYKISAKIQQLGGFVKESDLVQLTAVTDTMKLATERLALQAAQTVDRYIMEAIVMNQDLTAANGGSAVHVAKVSASRLAEGDKQLITSTGGSNGANVIAVSDVRSCAFILRRKNVPTVDGENYVGIIHPNVASDLQADSTWQNYHIYSTPEAVYRGEIGRVHGVRFVESTLAPVTRGSADAGAVSSAGISSIAYGTVIFGKGFYGVTELDGGIKTFTVTGPTKSDPLAQLDTYGWKANIAARVLNTSAGLILWCGSNDTLTAVSATSAATAAGLNVGANVWDDISGMDTLLV